MSTPNRPPLGFRLNAPQADDDATDVDGAFGDLGNDVFDPPSEPLYPSSPAPTTATATAPTAATATASAEVSKQMNPIPPESSQFVGDTNNNGNGNYNFNEQQMHNSQMSGMGYAPNNGTVPVNQAMYNNNGYNGDMVMVNSGSLQEYEPSTSVALLKCLIFVGILVIGLLIGLVVTVVLVLGDDDNSIPSPTVIVGPPVDVTIPTSPTLPPQPTNAPTIIVTEAPIILEPTSQPDTTLGRIHQRGYLRCGVGDSQPGFSELNLETGVREGIDIEMCRAVASAIFGTYEGHLELVTGTAFDRFSELYEGSFDVLTRATTHTMERALKERTTGQGFSFSIPYLYNGLQFGGLPPFVGCADNLTVAEEHCEDTKICVLDGTTHIQEIIAKIDGVQVVAVVGNEFLYSNFIEGFCNVIAGEQFDIAESILRDRGYLGDYEYGNYTHSKEPLCMVTRGDDPAWTDFVNWVVMSLVAAEDASLSQQSAIFIPTTNVFDDGVDGGNFATVFRDVIASLGNYGDVYKRTLESILPRPIPDYINSGSSGVLYAFPFGTSDGDAGPGPTPGGTLDEIVSRGFLRCGIARRVIFAQFNSTEQTWDGFDVDFCKAVSAAIFNGETDTVVYTDLPAAERFQALENGDVDVLSRLTTLNLERDVRESSVGVGFSFSPPNFYDGLSFGGIPPFASCADRLDITSISCQNLKICVVEGTTFEDRIRELFPLRFIVVTLSAEISVEEMNSGGCNVIAGGVVDVSLSNIRSSGYDGVYQNGNNRFSHDPLALVVRQDDVQWSKFVYWVVTGIIFAEEEGITSETSFEMMPAVTLFGTQYTDMLRDAVAAVGNYGEIYSRQAQSEFPRAGLNELNLFLSGPQHYPLPGVV